MDKKTQTDSYTDKIIKAMPQFIRRRHYKRTETPIDKIPPEISCHNSQNVFIFNVSW